MFQKVLLAVDVNHEESWAKALPIADEARGTEGELHLLGVIHDLGSAMVASYLPQDFETQALERMKTELDTFAEQKLAGKPNVATHVGHGHVAETIIKVAGQIDVDLIVMASHPPDELRSFLLGSEADKVVRHADRPVLVVR